MDSNNIALPGTQIVVEISPYDLLGYEFHTLSLFEEIGGKLVQGKLSMAPKQLHQEIEDQQAVYNWNSVYISIKDYSNEISYYIFGWITRKETIEKMLCIDFISFPYYKGGDTYCRQFLTLTKSKYYKIERQGAEEGLKQLVCSIWKGPWQREPWPDIRCTSVSNNLLPEYIWQRNESDYAFLNKILYSYKENSIFGYGLSGLFIKDIISENEPNKLVLGQVETTQETGFSRNFEYRLHQKHQNPWEQQGESEEDTGQFSVLTHDSDYSILSKDFSAMLYNYRQNNMIMKTRFFSSFQTYTVHQLPQSKLGECVSYTQKVDGENNKEGLFINSSNQYFFANPMSGDRDHHGNIFSVTSIYRGIEDNQQDLFKEQKEVVDIFGLNKKV